MRSAAATRGTPGGKARLPPIMPATLLGTWAVRLAAASIVLELAWRIVPFGGALGMACGFAGGTVGLVAILRDRERAVLVFAAVVPFLLVLAFVAAELIVGHD